MPIIPKYGPNTIQFKLKYRTIQAPIQTNTYTIFFILVPGTHTVELGAPAPALTTSTLFYRCGRGIWAFQSVHVLFHCINHILVLVRQFLCVLCQPNFPHLCEIPRRWFGRMTLHHMVGQSISAASGNPLSKECFGPERNHEGKNQGLLVQQCSRKGHTQFGDVYFDPMMHAVFLSAGLVNQVSSLAYSDSSYVSPGLPRLNQSHHFRKYWLHCPAVCGQFISKFQKFVLTMSSASYAY